MISFTRCLFTLSILIFASASLADGMTVDKVYHPYVLPNEREVEWRFSSSQSDKGNRLAQRLGYGHALSEYFTVEAYLIAERDDLDGDFDIQAYELEGRWMLFDQGQYWADWGILFEVEKQSSTNDWEAAIGVLFEKEFRHTSLTLNLFTVYEWGQTVENDFETEFRLKYRYRWQPEFQPSVEIYSGDDFFGIGPGFMGIYRIDRQKQIKWEAGFVTEISQTGKDHTLRFAIEYEF